MRMSRGWAAGRCEDCETDLAGVASSGRIGCCCATRTKRKRRATQGERRLLTEGVVGMEMRVDRQWRVMSCRTTCGVLDRPRALDRAIACDRHSTGRYRENVL